MRPQSACMFVLHTAFLVALAVQPFDENSEFLFWAEVVRAVVEVVTLLIPVVAATTDLAAASQGIQMFLIVLNVSVGIVSLTFHSLPQIHKQHPSVSETIRHTITAKRPVGLSIVQLQRSARCCSPTWCTACLPCGVRPAIFSRRSACRAATPLPSTVALSPAIVTA